MKRMDRTACPSEDLYVAAWHVLSSLEGIEQTGIRYYERRAHGDIRTLECDEEKGNHTLKAKLSWRWPTTTTNDGDDGHNHRTEPNHLEAILRVCVCVYVLRTSLVSPFAVGCLAWSIQAI